MVVHATKAFASDFDGTLLFDGWFKTGLLGTGRLISQDVEAIRAFRDGGGLFGICTGRALAGVTEVIGGAFGLDFCITVSGALVVDGKGMAIESHVLARDLCQGLVGRYVTPGVLAYLQGRSFFFLGESNDPMVTPIASLDKLSEDVHSISFGFEDAECAAQCAASIEEEYGDVVSAFLNVRSVDVVPVGCSKGQGVRCVRRHFGVGAIGGIGDSFNDLPLLREADVAYALDFAPKQVQDEADVVVPSVAQALSDLAAR